MSGIASPSAHNIIGKEKKCLCVCAKCFVFNNCSMPFLISKIESSPFKALVSRSCFFLDAPPFLKAVGESMFGERNQEYSAPLGDLISIFSL